MAVRLAIGCANITLGTSHRYCAFIGRLSDHQCNVPEILVCIPTSHFQHAFQDVKRGYLFPFPVPNTATSHGLHSFMTIIPLSELGIDAREICHLAKTFMAYLQEGKCFA